MAGYEEHLGRTPIQPGDLLIYTRGAKTVRRRFELRLKINGANPRVELFGETSDWRNGVGLVRVEGEDNEDTFAVTLDLPTGAYQYKLLVSCDVRSEWVLDPSNARTRSDKGLRNNVVVIDGAPEPWLFAPSAPWIEELERGGLRILAGLRRSAHTQMQMQTPRSIVVSWSEDDGATWSSVNASHAFDEDEHAFFTARLPASAPKLRIALERRSTGSKTVANDSDRYETSWSRTAAAERLPAWWKDAAIYGIFVDRFRPAVDRSGWELCQAVHEPGPRAGSGSEIIAGGHIDGIRRSLDELSDLGINTLYLTPVHVGASTSAHRYDLVDPLKIDPALGGDEAYAALVRDARRRGMRIIQDISFAHVGRGFPPYDDVLANGEASRFAPWFVWKADTTSGGDRRQLAHYGKRKDAPLLDQTNAEVQQLALDAVAFWAKQGASGLRLDMTAEVPIDLGRKIRRRFRELVPDGVVFGEVVPQHAWRWRGERVVDAATDFGFHEIITDLICRPDASVEEAFTKLARIALLRGGDEHVHAVRFLSTHDHPRLASLAATKGETAIARLPLAFALLATLPGIPMLLYGEELGLRSTDPNRDLEDVWPDRMCMPWTSHGHDPMVRATMRALFQARRESEALRSGSMTLVFLDETTVVYRRELDTEVVDVAVSFSNEPKTIELEDDEHPGLTPLVAIGGAEAPESSTVGAVRMPPHSAMIARRERTRTQSHSQAQARTLKKLPSGEMTKPVLGHGRAIAPALAHRNLALRDRDLVLGSAEASARPSRFFFSVTERCNLRCEHCITHAPERTLNGSARTMTPAVLDALAVDLGLADYFAFVHGGESLTTPIFFDVLHAIAAARGAQPYVAHLLTNGVLLNMTTAERLVESGVSSISVSLDGATAETNDAIRTGGRFHDVRENLRRVLAWRMREGIDLRVGLSTVILQQNAHELDAIVELGADLGVDWIKLEEGVPATPFAKRSLVSCTAPEMRVLVDRAMAHGRKRGLVMVDHTFDREVWRCRLDAADHADARAFLEADEMANRCVIHPCRTPWETACIEPNGDVRARDFFGPILGNITHVPLAELWNASPAQQLRRDAALTRLCGSGPVVCI